MVCSKDAIVSKARVVDDIRLDIHKRALLLQVEHFLSLIKVSPDYVLWKEHQRHPVALIDYASVLWIVILDRQLDLNLLLSPKESIDITDDSFLIDKLVKWCFRYESSRVPESALLVRVEVLPSHSNCGVSIILVLSYVRTRHLQDGCAILNEQRELLIRSLVGWTPKIY